MQIIQSIQNRIYEIRGHNVIMDFDLAKLYEVETKRLKEAVKRNINRFPDDFMFELTRKEFEDLRTQIASSKRGGIRYMPFAFTEQGIAMLSSVLKSDKAIQINISIMRTFVFVRRYALTHKDFTKRLHELETKYDKQFKDLLEAMNFLLQKDKQQTEQQQRRRIGFRPG